MQGILQLQGALSAVPATSGKRVPHREGTHQSAAAHNPKSAFYSTGYTLTRGLDRTSQVIFQHFPGTFVNFSMTLQDLVWRVLKVTPEKIRETFTQIQLTTLSGDFINIGSSTEYATGDERHSEHVSLLSKVFTPTVLVLS